MGDGRDGLSEAVHLAAEKSRLAAEVTALRIALTIEQDRVKQLSDEVERLRSELRRVSRNNGWFDPDGPTPLETAEAEVERLKQMLDAEGGHG